MDPAPAQPMRGARSRGIESLAEFDEVVAEQGTLARYRVQAVDPTGRTDVLPSLDTVGAVFPGCAMNPEAAARVRSAGALVFPPVPGLPFDPYRAFTYTPDELFESLEEGCEATPDARAYAWYRHTKADGDVFASMPRAIHDDAVSDAMDELLVGARVVGEGGHATGRGTARYAGAARLGRELARPSSPSRPAAGRDRWRRRTSARTRPPSRTRCWTRRSNSSPRSPRSGRPSPTEPAPPSRCGPAGPRAAPPSASPPGSTAMSPGRLRLGHREVLRRRHPGGRSAGPLHRRGGLPAGRRRDRAGDLRQRDAELLRVARRARSHGAGGRGPLDTGVARPAAAALARGGPVDESRIALVDRIEQAPEAIKRLDA